MTVYFVDDAGTGTAPYDTWAKAATSLSALDDAVSFASGDIVYIGHDHVCQFTHSANRTITGPTTGFPTIIISVTQGSDPPAYAVATADQVDTSEGAYSLTFDGSFALYGVRVKSGSTVNFTSDSNEVFLADSVYIKLGNASSFNAPSGNITFRNITFDCSADTGATAVDIIQGTSQFGGGANAFTLVNTSNRTGQMITSSCASIDASGATGSGCDVAGITAIGQIVTNVKTNATWSAVDVPSSVWQQSGTLHNAGPSYDKDYMYHWCGDAQIIASTAKYRTGGGQTEGSNVGWLCYSGANVSEQSIGYTPWIYGTISSTGSKNFDIYVVHDNVSPAAADFDNSQCWLEVQYFATSGSPVWSLATDHRVITDTATTSPGGVSRDDTGSTWNGTGPAFDYPQRLRVTAAVNQTGQFRARVCYSVASMTAASSIDFIVDPKVTVSS